MQRPLRLLVVVEDNHDAADLLALLLQIRSHRSHTEHGSANGLRVVVEFQLEVVLFDLGMPGINGHEAACRLRAEAHVALVVGRLCRPRPTHGRETVCPRNCKVVFRINCANSKELTMSTQAIDALHDVHTATNDVLKGFREMSVRAKPDIQAVIRRLTDMHDRHAAEQAAELVRLRASGKDDTSMQGTVNKVVVILRDWLSDLDRDVLPAVRDGEESLRDEYAKALRVGQVAGTPSVAALLKTQMDAINGEIDHLPQD